MYVRDAKNRDEVWLLDRIEEADIDDPAFRSRDYVIALDEETSRKAGFGRIRVHKPDDSEDICELTSIGVIENWRGQGVGAHVVERLVEYAGDEGFDTVYALTGERSYLAQFGFQRIAESDLPAVLQDRLAAKRDGSDPDAVPLSIDIAAFQLPDRLREAFKRAPDGREDADTEELPEDFGIDPDSATYKYDTGR